MPNFLVNFSLRKAQLTLVKEIQSYSGIEFTSEDFTVRLKMYDAENKYQKHKLDLSMTNRLFEMNVVNRDTDGKIVYCPFMQMLHKEKSLPEESKSEFLSGTDQLKLASNMPGAGLIQAFHSLSEFKQSEHLPDDQAIALDLVLGNMFHQQSDLPLEEKTKIDLGVKLRLRPVEIIY